jgi:hypothetical protein
VAPIGAGCCAAGPKTGKPAAQNTAREDIDGKDLAVGAGGFLSYFSSCFYANLRFNLRFA